MAYLDPNEAFAHLKQRTLESIAKQFPIEGRGQVIELDGLELEGEGTPDDFRAQATAKISGETWGPKVVARLTLRDKKTGKTTTKRTPIAQLPQTTSRYSYILGGQEFTVDNQWQLKPGAYTKRRQNNELETRFQAGNKPSFDMVFDDKSQVFRVEYGKAKIPAYPIMKAMGLSDAEMEKALGKEVFSANKNASRVDSALDQFYRTTRRGQEPPSSDAAVAHLRRVMDQTDLRPDATQLTLGKPVDRVTSEALLLAAQKLMRVQAGEPEDDRDSLQFKDLRSLGDYVADKIDAASRNVRDKAQRALNKKTLTSPREVIKYDTFSKPIREAFHKNSAAQVAKQVNPVEMVGSVGQTTVMGVGGIQSERQILDTVKFVNPSQLGFLDPINTPEGSKTGVTLRLPIGVRKVGNEPQLPLYDIKTGKTEYVGPTKFVQSKVVMPDQVDWKDGRPTPRGVKVKASVVGNDIKEIDLKEADYVMRHSSQMFNPTSNLIPFLNNNSGGRASMAARHIEQAIALEAREAPLVQVATPSNKPGQQTFEQVLGRQAAHHSPVDGKVKSVGRGSIVVETPEGDREVQIYDNYPLNDAKSVLDSTPLVRPGDRVKKGQVLADTNFSKDGTLALGKNLRVAYIPLHGYNFEDGVVISESAADKMKSVHLHKKAAPVDAGTVLDKKRFMLEHHGAYVKDQLAKVGDDGVVQVGQRVDPGDPLVLAMKKFELKDRVGLSAIRKSLAGRHNDKSLTWQGETAGEVVAVHKKDGQVAVHVRTVEPMQVGDKVAGRYGNKGIVTRIVPDAEMPKTRDGVPIEVALNPSGVPGRMNIGQVLETAASKIAEKTGTPYIAKNFEGGDAVARLQADLKKHGLSDTEELVDPGTGKSLGKALVGKQHLLKLHHQIDKKVSVRSGMDPEKEKYSLNLQPSGGGHHGGQSMDPLGMYAMLAHGAKANIREMTTWKSEGPDPQTNPQKRWASQHHDVWDAIQYGDPLPTPKSTFAFEKFTSMLKGAGVNIEKKGHEFLLTPLTDKHIKQLTGDRVLPHASRLVDSKLDPVTGDPKPRPGGLFDPKLTGGHGGKQWSRIDLAEPMPNPVFEDSIRILTGLKQEDFDAVIGGDKAVNKKGEVVALGMGVAGGAGIKMLLDQIDVEKELKASREKLNSAPKSGVDKELKRTKRLQALQQAGMTASEAYVVSSLPVIPPAMRPVSVMHDGNFKFADVNELYRKFASLNEDMADPNLAPLLPEKEKQRKRAAMYDGLKAITGLGAYDTAKHKGFIHQIQGSSPKKGYFQSQLTSRKQDLSMRSTIIPEPALSLDEVGLPREHAMHLMKPFVVRELRKSGVARNTLEAQKMVDSRDRRAYDALDRAAEQRPVLIKRDPSLHKYSVQAYTPKIVDGNAIRLHPLSVGGFNADFDGDTMSVFVPISAEAVNEAKKMMPSNNLFSEATGRVMYQPTLESALGLYKLSRVNDEKKVKKFKSHVDALNAAKDGKLDVNDPVQVGKQRTTVGRALIAAALPESMQQKVMEDLTFRVDKKGLGQLFTQVAKEHKGNFGVVADKLKNIGNGAASGLVTVEHANYVGGGRLDPAQKVTVPVGVHTLTLDDFKADAHTRDAVMGKTQAKVDQIEKRRGLTPGAKELLQVKEWQAADEEIKAKHLAKHGPKPSNLLTMQAAGVKPQWGQFKQMVLTPMLMEDASGRIIPTPIKKSYAEGLDTADYWVGLHGARRGAVKKVQEVQEPGYLSKLLMANTVDMVVAGDDCGTQRGVAMPITDNQVHDRVLQQDFSYGKLRVPKGTELTPDLVAQMRAADKNSKVVVRSPLRCEHSKGICRKCAGLNAEGRFHDLGENVGVAAAQTLGERAMQLTMQVFHTGGAAGAGGGVVGGFDRFAQLTTLPKKLSGVLPTTLAHRAGVVTDVKETATGVDVYIDGKRQRKSFVGKDKTGMPLWKPVQGLSTDPGWTPPKVGMRVERGQPLADPARTTINPHDLYEATGSIEKVQGYLTDQIYDLYKSEGIRKTHVETLVKSMSHVGKVDDPGDYEGVLRGEFHPTSKVFALNKELQRQGKNPIQITPVLKGVDMLPLASREDFMAKLQHQRLNQTILEAAATYGKSNVHGLHPIPGMAYGAEFGLTSADAKKDPNLKHLADVPTFYY